MIAIAFLSMFFLVGGVTAQTSGTPAPQNGSAAGVAWLTDMEAAKTLAAETNRFMLINFTGSDWCPPCMQLKRDILSTEGFAAYAAENLVLLELDFPRRTAQPEHLRAQNRQLSSKFNINGFPTLVLLDPKAKELTRSVGYMRGGPEEFVKWAEKARAK